MKSLFTNHQANLFEKLGVFNWFDLLMHIPVRYEDRTKIKTTSDFQAGELCLISGEIFKNEIMFRGRRNLIVHIEDINGNKIFLRFINFYPNQVKQLQSGKFVLAYGAIKKNLLGIEMIHPEVTVSDSPYFDLPKTYTPIYATTAGLNQKIIQKIINKALNSDEVISRLQRYVFRSKNLHELDLLNAFINVHKPKKSENILDLNNYKTTYHESLKYAELLAQQIFMKFSREKNVQKLSQVFLTSSNHLKKIIEKDLPFSLTQSQINVIEEIEKDLSIGKCMYRLLQGDVGSGKTIVAILAATNVLNKNYQVAFMAPTEILANQHFEKFKDWFSKTNVKVELLTGNIKGNRRKIILEEIENGTVNLVVGTHALFQENVNFNNLGLCIIDEQHRFGVKQRLDLMNKGKKNQYFPHQLMMSATPIPRTLSMSFFADLEVSTIKEMPRNRSPIKTKLIRESRRLELIKVLKKELTKQNQIYWVCPLIEESEKLNLKNVTNTYEDFLKLLPESEIGIIHGKMKESEKDQVMQNFIHKKINLLVATTVIEVGVDVPNASVMVIEHAERMGLSQLHQLRGRVGRGHKESTCILIFKENLSDNAKERLQIIYENIDGFIIAENDLRIRGPGEMIGTRQSGIPNLKVANLVEDADLVEEAHHDAKIYLKEHQAFAKAYSKLWFEHKNYLRI
ncbi:MAG: ATP-dependent DNA helicase RecG [Proteobacteria bacterium]|nr:ATP-dependent DNA helicase RecG [Pseudomonadota bacterium]MDA0941915.1 ATP-dependent DNA helicase RecG [Pseudomonadota bacterium]